MELHCTLELGAEHVLPSSNHSADMQVALLPRAQVRASAAMRLPTAAMVCVSTTPARLDLCVRYHPDNAKVGLIAVHLCASQMVSVFSSRTH